MTSDAACVSWIRRAAAVAGAAALCWPTSGAMAQAVICDPATYPFGAHAIHTTATFARSALPCIECHAPLCSPGSRSNVVFGPLASTGGARPVWSPSTRTCSGVYCHGATLPSPPGPVTWAYVAPGIVRPPAQQCTICHGYPPPAPHPSATDCRSCHPASILASGAIDVAGGHHADGKIDVAGGACNACHGWPPATGAHLAHYGLAGGSGYGDLTILQDRYPGATPLGAPAVYAFGCGNCHPMTTGHQNGRVDVVLWEAAAPAGTLKSRASTTASYDAVAKTCSGVYCHSSGQASPAFVTTPGWFSGTKLACSGCHANPPRYPSGGAGAATANSHLDLADDGYEFGHFLGLLGPWHTSKHGGNWAGQDAAAITCQSCHYDTTDPANTGPSGFYYLDTTGDYALPGGDPMRITSGWQAANQCGCCHKAGGAAIGTGRVLPLRHVNGAREVVFDPRTTLPGFAWLPAAPNTPTAPYWMTGGKPTLPWPAWVTWSGTTVSFGLNGAAYDPVTKTCSNVACHLAELQPVWGKPYVSMAPGSQTCNSCHPM